MQVALPNISVLAFFLGGDEIVLVLAVVILLYGFNQFPELKQKIGQGIQEFLKTLKEVRDGIDKQPFEAGRSLGGIHGKTAAEALTPDNHTAELYDSTALRDDKKIQRIAKKSFRERFHFPRALKMGMLVILIIGTALAILFLLH